ncbi:MAG: CBS domain-containing protein [Saprospiraceae bacterium]
MLSVNKLLEGKRSHATWWVTPNQMVIEALELMAEQNIGAVLVMEGDRLAGIFSERDYARKGIVQGRKAQSTPVSEVMTANVFTVSPDMTIEDCMNLFSSKRIRHLPVMDGDKVVGLLSIGDIVSAIIQEQTSHIQFLEQYIMRT